MLLEVERSFARCVDTEGLGFRVISIYIYLHGRHFQWCELLCVEDIRILVSNLVEFVYMGEIRDS